MHAESFTGVGTNAVARLVSISSDFLLNVPVVTVKSEMTVWGRLFRTVGEAWQKAHLEEQQLEAQTSVEPWTRSWSRSPIKSNQLLAGPRYTLKKCHQIRL